MPARRLRTWCDSARRTADRLLAEARDRGAALAVATILAHRAFIDLRCGDVTSAEADSQAAIELASDLLGSEFVVVMAVFLWLTDKTLEWALYDLILGWKKT